MGAEGQQLVGIGGAAEIGARPDDDPDRVAGQELPYGGGRFHDLVGVVLTLEAAGGATSAAVPVGEMMRRWPPCVYCTQLANPAVWSPPSTISVWPLPYRSASAGVEKSLSEVNHGNPFRVDPVAAAKAYSSWPTEGATTSVPPCRSPMDNDARTADVAFALVSVRGFFTARNQRLVPSGLNASYPPLCGVAASPTPTKTTSSPESSPSGATEGVESIGIPPVLAGQPGYGLAGGEGEGVQVTGPVPHHDGGYAVEGGDVG